MGGILVAWILAVSVFFDEVLTSSATENFEEKKIECNLVPEILFVQDATAWFEPYVRRTMEILEELVEDLRISFKGRGKVGMVSFKDKPISRYGNDPAPGYQTSYCAKIEQELISLSDPDVTRLMVNAYDNLLIDGGSAWHESGSEAMLRAALSSDIGWSTEDHTVDGEPIARIIIFSTDAASHDEYYTETLNAQHQNHIFQELNYPAWFDLISNNDINAQCLEAQPPRRSILGRALRFRKIIPIIFAGPPFVYNSNGVGSMSLAFRQTWGIKDTGNDDPRYDQPGTYGLLPYYERLLDDIGVPGVVEFVDTLGDRLSDLLRKTIEGVASYACDPTAGLPTPEKPTDEPSQSPDEPSQSPDEPSQSPDEPSQSPDEPSQSPDEPSQSPDEPSQSPDEPSQSPDEPSQSPDEPSQSPDEPSQSPDEPSQSPDGELTPPDEKEPPSGESTQASGSDESAYDTEEDAGGASMVVVGAAAAGGVAGVAAAGIAAARYLGMLGGGAGAAPAVELPEDLEFTTESPDREQVEGISGDMFS